MLLLGHAQSYDHDFESQQVDYRNIRVGVECRPPVLNLNLAPTDARLVMATPC